MMAIPGGCADDGALLFFGLLTALGSLLGVSALIDRALERRSRRRRDED